MSVYNLGQPRGVVRPSPLFLLFVALTGLGGALAWVETEPGSRLGDFGVFVFALAGWIVSVCFHEFAHAYAAYRAGDRSVEARGYLTLNPFKYAHPVLSIILPLAFIAIGGIGLPGGAVYLHPHTFRSRVSRAIASASGPLVNLVLGAVLIWVAKANDGSFIGLFASDGTQTGHSRFWCAVAFLAFLQLTAAVLNLLPVPGLDGWSIIEPYVAPETARAAERIKPWGLLGVIVLLTIDDVNRVFFDLVYSVYDLFDSSEISKLMASFGREYFRWWASAPL